jgi:predicted secreted protein
MKRNTFLILVAILLLPVLAFGCQTEEPATPDTPALNGDEATVTLELGYDDFTAQANITKDIEINHPGSLTVTLYSNPTTGFQWVEAAEVSQSEVIEQVSHEFVAPESSGDGLVGAPGKDVRVFDSKQAGSAIIKFSYGRPWEGGEKDAWTVTLNITVK